MEKAHVLVTGGAGYLGSILVPTLLREGYSVTVLDNFYYEQNSLLDLCADPNFDVVWGDCRNEKTLETHLKKADVIIPLAAMVGVPVSNRDEISTKTVNYGAIASLIKLRSKEQKILYPTTNSGYGIGQEGIFCTEETPLNPISLYGQTKVDAEKALLDDGDAITFRLATLFGMSPRMRIDLLVNDFTYRAITEHYLVLFEAHFKRNYLHVRDAARAFVHGIKNWESMKNEPYNVGLSDANLSKRELSEAIKTFVPKLVIMENEIGKDPDKRNYIVSNDKIENTGFKTTHKLEDGIQELIKGFQILRNTRYGNN